VDRLRKACAEGRLAVAELEQRVAVALKARTYGELDATVADLPGQRLSAERSTGARAARTVRAHPALLVVAVPVALVAVATVVAITVLWAVLALALVLLGHRRHVYWGPAHYVVRHSYGRPYRRYGGRGPASSASWRV